MSARVTPSAFLLQQKHFLSAALLALLFVHPATAQTKKDTSHTTPVNTHTIWGKVDGVAVEGMVQGPSTEVTQLQIVCVFEYTEGDIFNSPPALPPAVNGMVHLDEAFKGMITDIRKSGQFAGHAYETLLITPAANTIAAKQLLIIGLGDRNAFTPDLMTNIARVAMREALRLGVSDYAFASDLKDAGIDSPTALVAENVVKGTFQAYRTQTYLQTKKLSTAPKLHKVTLLAGPSFYPVAGEGIKAGIATFK